MKPIIKWVGGKTQLLPELRKLIPTTQGCYFEPFIGGGAVFLDMASRRAFGSAVINDVNPELTNLYTVVRDVPNFLMGRLDCLRATPDWNTLDFFLDMRAKEPVKLDPISRAVRFIYLNKTAFNGLYRENKSGQFNVPFGKYSNPTLYVLDNLLQCSEALQGVSIRTGSFRECVPDAQPGDVVYFDPPYVPVSKTANFTSYASIFREEKQRELADVFRSLVGRGVICVLSNSDTPLVHELYGDFTIHTVGARRSINRDGDKRGKINELVVCGVPVSL